MHAMADDRVVLTEDQDFGELVMRENVTVEGVILLELDRLSSAAEAQRVAAVVAEYADRIMGYLVVVEPTRLRFRPLNHFVP